MYYQEEEEEDSRSSRLTGQFTPVYFTHYLTKVYTLPKEKQKKGDTIIVYLDTTVKAISTEPHWDQHLCSEQRGVRFIQIELTEISYIEALFKVRFIQDSGLFRVRFKQVLQYNNVIFTQDIFIYIQLNGYILSQFIFQIKQSLGHT